MILVTGANGFVGKRLLSQLGSQKLAFVAATRHGGLLSGGIESVGMGDINSQTDWSRHLVGMQCVIHLAGRAHITTGSSPSEIEAFRRVNLEATERLARQAASLGVKRLVYLSSVKVNGEFTRKGSPFNADDIPTPEDAYGTSKHQAEQGLRQIAAESGMEVVIIRPPLVYGSGVKANFESMMRWLSLGLPLPFASVTENRRSLVALDNLVDLIVTCLHHPAAANQTFLVSDAEDLSTADLLRRLGVALGKPARLFHMPLSTIECTAGTLGKLGLYRRLCGSLQVDITKTTHLLGWSPPVSVDEGLRRAAAGFR